MSYESSRGQATIYLYVYKEWNKGTEYGFIKNYKDPMRFFCEWLFFPWISANQALGFSFYTQALEFTEDKDNLFSA